MSALAKKILSPRANAIQVISPYRAHGTWVFDDPAVGLKAEPFVSGVPAMIDELVQDIPNAERGLRLTFSPTPFPGYQAEYTHIRPEYGGSWYRHTGGGRSNRDTQAEGWLCSALFHYFDQAPEKLYVKAEPL